MGCADLLLLELFLLDFKSVVFQFFFCFYAFFSILLTTQGNEFEMVAIEIKWIDTCMMVCGKLRCQNSPIHILEGFL